MAQVQRNKGLLVIRRLDVSGTWPWKLANCLLRCLELKSSRYKMVLTKVPQSSGPVRWMLWPSSSGLFRSCRRNFWCWTQKSTSKIFALGSLPCSIPDESITGQVDVFAFRYIYIYIYDIHISIIVSTFIILSCKKHQNHQPTSTYPPDHAFANIDCEWCLRNP